MTPHFNRKPAGRPPAEPSLSSPLLLVCDAESTTLADGRWHFALEAADGTPVMEAGDREPGDLNRLALLAAVRGLEAIDGPASVTLMSKNRYLIRSLVDSLPRWRANGFAWEYFGRRLEVQNADLWRRLDRATEIHRVEALLVSSRPVGGGGPSRAKPGFSGGNASRRRVARVDAGHRAVPAPKAGGRPSDRLRTWLLGLGGNRDGGGEGTSAARLEVSCP